MSEPKAEQDYDMCACGHRRDSHYENGACGETIDDCDCGCEAFDELEDV